MKPITRLFLLIFIALLIGIVLVVLPEPKIVLDTYVAFASLFLADKVIQFL